ncbi:hypothetical protein GCM10020256_73250 [Streptomyces thermocoprophilus]
MAPPTVQWFQQVRFRSTAGLMNPVRKGSDPPLSAGARDLFDASSDAAAVLSARGDVLGWTRAAEDLLGYPASEVVGRPAMSLVALPGDPVRVAGIAERCRNGMGWNGSVPLRHRDGRSIDTDLRVSASFGIGDDECFLLSARERQLRWTVGESVLDGFLTRSPAGMAVTDRQLRYVWLNDTLERLGGVPREQRLGRRLSEVLPGLRTDIIEGLMRKVLETGEPVTDYEYVGWSWSDPHRRHAYSPPSSRWSTATTASAACATWSWTSPSGGTPAVCCRWSARPAPASAAPSTCRAPPRNWPTSRCRASPTSSSSTCWNPS